MGTETRVLVIDDDEVVLVAISDVLEDAGFRVFTQASAIGATQTITRERIDLVVIDINMPVMQGDTVIRLFRSWDKMRDLPVVVITGADTATLSEIKRALPDISVVRKMSMNHDLVPVVQQALVARGAQRALSEKPGSANDLMAQFTQELARLAPRVREVPRCVEAGEDDERIALVRVLDKSRDRAQLLGLVSVSDVIEQTTRAIKNVRPRGGTDPNILAVLTRAADALHKLPRLDLANVSEEMSQTARLIERLHPSRPRS